MRILGLDVGSKTIGVAVSDELGWTAQGITTISRESDPKAIAGLKSLIQQYRVEKIIVGLPLHMSGEEGESARTVKAFLKKLESAQSPPLPIQYWDERLSTTAAERSLLEADLSRAKRKKVINKMAAVFILQGYLDSLKSGDGYANVSPDPPSGAKSCGINPSRFRSK